MSLALVSHPASIAMETTSIAVCRISSSLEPGHNHGFGSCFECATILLATCSIHGTLRGTFSNTFASAKRTSPSRSSVFRRSSSSTFCFSTSTKLEARARLSMRNFFRKELASDSQLCQRETDWYRTLKSTRRHGAWFQIMVSPRLLYHTRSKAFPLECYSLSHHQRRGATRCGRCTIHARLRSDGYV